MTTTITTTPVNVTVGPATLTGREWTLNPLLPWSGDVSGAATTYRTRNSAKEKTVHAFVGVQYAEHPVGARRWKQATDYDYPAGTFDVSTWPDVPLQSYTDEYGTDGRPEWGLTNGLQNWTGYGVQESESVATLNIWRPSGTPPVGGWPVIFWIHGGSWTLNSAIMYNIRGHRQAAEGAIVVTVEYPLSNFGHFYSPEMAQESDWVSPNFALSFIKSALRWTNRNIGSFGGNTAKLLIGGSSAGGAATLALLEDATADGLYTSAWVTSGGGNGNRWDVAASSVVGAQNPGYAARYGNYHTAITAIAPLVPDYSIPARTLAEAIAADGYSEAIRNGLTPQMVEALADGRDRLTTDSIFSGSPAYVYAATPNFYPLRDVNLDHQNTTEAAKAGAMTKVPTVFLAAENEASLISYASYNPDMFCRLLGIDNFTDWQARAWVSGGWADSERRRLVYNHSIFQYPAWRQSKAIDEDGGTCWRVLWNYSVAGAFANHTSDVAFLFGNVEWQVSVSGSEAMVTVEALEMGDAMMRALRNMAANGNPSTAYVYASGFDLFASPTTFTMTQVDQAAQPYRWNMIGNTTGSASGAPVSLTYTDYFASTWLDYVTLIEG